jgi:hypothetical protein
MKRKIGGSVLQTTTYIPQQFAVIGRTLKLKGDDEIWVDGWVVERVGYTTVESDSVPDYRKAIRNHRKQTGDSLPRNSV